MHRFGTLQRNPASRLFTAAVPLDYGKSYRDQSVTAYSESAARACHELLRSRFCSCRLNFVAFWQSSRLLKLNEHIGTERRLHAPRRNRLFAATCTSCSSDSSGGGLFSCCTYRHSANFSRVLPNDRSIQANRSGSGWMSTLSHLERQLC